MDNTNKEYQNATLPFEEQSLDSLNFSGVNQLQNIPTQFFLPGSVNVFVDASKQTNDPMASIAACMSFTDINNQTSIFRSEVVFIDSASISQAELVAIDYGTYISRQYYPSVNIVNLFSDSIENINAIRSILVSPNFDSMIDFVKDPTLRQVIVNLIQNPVRINLLHFKSHVKNVSYIYNKFVMYNGFPINLYDIIKCAGFMAMVDSDASMALKNRNTCFRF